jgi:hypothetical protein
MSHRKIEGMALGTAMDTGEHDEDHSRHLHTFLEDIAKAGWPEGKPEVQKVVDMVSSRLDRMASALTKALVMMHVVQHSEADPGDPDTWMAGVESFGECDSLVCAEGRDFLTREGYGFGGAIRLMVQADAVH